MSSSRQYWDNEAETFDSEPDHGLHDPKIRLAWLNLLREFLPSQSSDVLDIGCGTGSLSVILAELKHKVTGIDFSPKMIAKAQAKATQVGHDIAFHVMDAAKPNFSELSFDVVLCRHVLWALPEPEKVLLRWSNLLKPAGRMILIEGYWHTGGGLHAKDVVGMLPPNMSNIQIIDLSQQAALWGGTVNDERYIVAAVKS